MKTLLLLFLSLISLLPLSAQTFLFLEKDTVLISYETPDNSKIVLDLQGYTVRYTGSVPFKAGTNSRLHIKNGTLVCDNCIRPEANKTYLGRCKKGSCLVEWTNLTREANNNDGMFIRHGFDFDTSTKLGG